MEKLRHVAIIVDGNGRWAKKKGKTRSEGHLEGSKMLERIIFHTARTTDIEVLSLYVFSTENFKRDKKEVDYLMNLFMKWFEKSRKQYKNENINYYQNLMTYKPYDYQEQILENFGEKGYIIPV